MSARWAAFRRSRSACTALRTVLGLIVASPVLATDYFLSPSGDDSHLGTRAQPWRTLDHANRLLRAGDSATLLGGTYPGTPTRDGQQFWFDDFAILP